MESYKIYEKHTERTSTSIERPKQIPLFLLEVSEGSNDPNPDKIRGDRRKLMNEGVFALNKFVLSTELPKWCFPGSKIW
ncbi:4070_t:CDS:2 [Diversispora eburnea]|uniref:4070_t:CDS:1 n=1 Tax=Diversispora eburnea TaxID=1213867 RepID=A0A9N9AQI1_9GLOM|nr:4070_t:CDS:2 [Diversispora eburnea]